MQARDQLCNLFNIGTGRYHSIRQIGLIEKRTKTALHVDHYRRAGGESFHLQHNIVNVLLEHLAGNVIAIQLGHFVGCINGIGTFIIENRDLLLCLGRDRLLAAEFIGRQRKIQFCTIVCVDNVTLKPHHPAQPGNNKHQ